MDPRSSSRIRKPGKRLLRSIPSGWVGAIFFLFWLPVGLVAQPDPLSEADIVTRIADYRSDLLRQNPAATGALRQLELKWGDLNTYQEEFKLLAVLARETVDRLEMIEKSASADWCPING